MTEWIDFLGNRVFPLTGRARKKGPLELIPMWKRQVGKLKNIRRLSPFSGLRVTWDSELAFET